MTSPARQDGTRASALRKGSWPDVAIVGPAVSQPVTVYSTVAKDARGELAHEGNRVPDIVALDADHLVIGWRAGATDSQDPTPTDQGTIKYAHSANGGVTWTVGTLAAATSTYRYHYVIFLNDRGTLYALLGRITIATDRKPDGEVDGFPVAMVAKKSTDNGHTWADFPINVAVGGNSRGVVVAGKPLKHDGVWLVPYWQNTGGTTRAGVLRSTDLVTWTPGGLAQNPPRVAIEEPQIAISQDDPGTLVMMTRTLNLAGAPAPEKDAFYRAHACYAATSTSTDGGLTWSAMTLDENIPNYYVKGFFTKDSQGRYLAIYNTLAGPFTGASADRPDQYREVLYYKVKSPGAPWGPGRLFADGPRLTTGAARGWDVYASADEYEPGRFVVVWEHNQINIKVAKLGLSNGDHASGGLIAEGSGTWRGWTMDPGGGTAAITGGAVRLRSANGKTARASIVLDPSKGCDFTVEFRGRIDDDSALDPRSGQGVCLGTKVANGAKRLMLTIQKNGVWTMRKGGSLWEKIYSLSVAAQPATWKVTVDSAGVARLHREGAYTGVSWVVQDSREIPNVTHWVTGTSGGNAAEAHIDWTRVTSSTQAPGNPDA